MALASTTPPDATVVLIFRNMSSSKTPDVPPMDADTASAREEKRVAGWDNSRVLLSRRDKISVAPRFMVIPQSPSPTMVSYLVRSGSFSTNTLAASLSMDAAVVSKGAASWISGNFAAAAVTLSAGSFSGISVADALVAASSFFHTSHLLQARAEQSASNNSMSSVSPMSGKIVRDAPCMSKDVMKLPTRMRLTVHPSSSSNCLTMDRTKMDISKFEVPPRLLTRIQTSSPLLKSGTISPDSSSKRPKSRIVVTISLANSSDDMRLA
mmetsp:Transcript_33318/g.51030  ORF Transcript_33318/g.51030 Transcript_33318/m.51030 type:complete len:267 (-) Transcript_33318:52-852(-)